jgi:alkylated DNA repair dioxygenase AlkB
LLNPLTRTTILNRDGWLDYIPQVFEAGVDYFNLLLTQCQWEHETVQVYGKWHQLQRQIAWYGTANYRYAGQVKVARHWLPVILEIRAKVQEQTGDDYSGCLLNYYPDGSAGMGCHSDDERDLVPQATIASVSFGATRRFDLRHRDGEQVSLDLEDRSVLIMGGELQHYWKHRLSVQKRVQEARINLTFRVMV